MTDPSATNFDPIYVPATMLHPSYRELLQPDQLEAGKAHMIDTLHQLQPDLVQQEDENEEQPPVDAVSQVADQPKPKHF